MDFKEHSQQLGNLQKQLDHLIKMQDIAFSKMTPEQYSAVKEQHSDAHEMIRKLKKGEYNTLDTLINKYNKPKL
tara:strand:+ start:413 stop:634 length:222 start_codon:yes stop_codon:yes gene_type:complete